MCGLQPTKSVTLFLYKRKGQIRVVSMFESLWNVDIHYHVIIMQRNGKKTMGNFILIKVRKVQNAAIQRFCHNELHNRARGINVQNSKKRHNAISRVTAFILQKNHNSSYSEFSTTFIYKILRNRQIACWKFMCFFYTFI